MSERHANVQPSLSPVRIPGSAAGRITRVYSRSRRAPIVRAARMYIVGTARTAPSVAMVIDSIDPMTTTNRIAFSDSPNHRSASGSQQIDGSACSPTTSGPTAARSQPSRANMTPSVMPPPADSA